MAGGRKEYQEWQLVKRLDAIINILLETAESGGKPLSISKRIELLDSAGLRPIEISKLIGKTLTYVTSELTRIRKLRHREQRLGRTAS